MERFSSNSEAVLLELIVELLHIFALHNAAAGLNLLLLEIKELLGSGSSLLLKSVDEALLGPAHLDGEITESAELAIRLQSEALEGLGNDDSLLVVIGGGNTLEDLEAAEGGGTLCLLVGEHGAEGLPEHP